MNYSFKYYLNLLNLTHESFILITNRKVISDDEAGLELANSGPLLVTLDPSIDFALGGHGMDDYFSKLGFFIDDETGFYKVLKMK